MALVDDDGAEGPQSSALTVTTDNVTPGAPSAPDLLPASDTGTSNSDNTTSDTTPTFQGTSEANATVQLFADATLVGSVIATGTSWTITSTALAVGTYSMTAVQTDPAGNGPSVASAGLSVTINTSVPAAPSTPDLLAASDSGPSSTDNITSDPTPTLSGTAEAGSTVELFAGATSVGTATATGGNWSITSIALTSGTYAFTATATNVAGTSVASSALSVTIYTALDVTINQAAAQADPTGTSPINFTAVFTNPVSNFASGDVTITGTAGGSKTVAVTGGPATYNVAVSGLTTLGTVTATVAASVASDAAGNNNAASTSADNTVTWDPTPGPTVTINQASGQVDPTGASPINFTVVFNATVTGFTDSDVVITGTAGGTKTVTLSGAGPTYTAAVSGMTSSGTVIATIPAGAAVGTSGSHPTQASTSTDNSVTFALASKWVVTPSSTTPSPGSTITITAQLADAIGTAIPGSGIVVSWSSTNGGTFSSLTSTTNANGVATVSFTVSGTLGTVHTVTATGNSLSGTTGNITVSLNSATLTLTSTLSTTTWRQFIALNAQFSGNERRQPCRHVPAADRTCAVDVGDDRDGDHECERARDLQLRAAVQHAVPRGLRRRHGPFGGHQQHGQRARPVQGLALAGRGQDHLRACRLTDHVHGDLASGRSGRAPAGHLPDLQAGERDLDLPDLGLDPDGQRRRDLLVALEPW